MNFHDKIFMLPNNRRPYGICINNDYINVINSKIRYIELKIQNRQETYNTEKDEKLISHNNWLKMQT